MKTFILSTALGIAALFGVSSFAAAADTGEKVLPSNGVQTDTQATTQVRYGFGWGNRGYYNRGYYGGYRPYYRSYYRPYYGGYYGNPYYGNGVYIGRGGVRIGW